MVIFTVIISNLYLLKYISFVVVWLFSHFLFSFSDVDLGRSSVIAALAPAIVEISRGMLPLVSDVHLRPLVVVLSGHYHWRWTLVIHSRMYQPTFMRITLFRGSQNLDSSVGVVLGLRWGGSLQILLVNDHPVISNLEQELIKLSPGPLDGPGVASVPSSSILISASDSNSSVMIGVSVVSHLSLSVASCQADLWGA